MSSRSGSTQEQATLFTTIVKWIGLLIAVLLMVGLTGISFLSRNLIWYSAVGGFGALSLAVALCFAIYLGWVPPTWAWIPPVKRKRDCARVRFSPQKARTKQYDAIVVGSGISGLTTAAVLTQLGYRACVLEAHEVAGGSTHEYNVNGNTDYKFPSGLHYVIPSCEQVLQVSLGSRSPTVKFPKLGNPQGIYERIRLTLSKQDDLPIQNEMQLRKELHARFPGLKIQLERFEQLATSVLTCFPLWSALHILPWSLRKPAAQFILPSVWYKYANQTAEQVISELFADAPESEQDNVNQLTAYLCSLWVDTGCPPHRVSFFMIAAVCLGFPHEGGAYPVGGPEAIGATLVERIEAGGGDVFVRAPVKRIVVNEDDGRAVGVEMSEKFGGGATLLANKCVVSACGWRNTSRLLSKGDGFPDISELKIPQGEGFVMANIGIKGTAQELGLECCNLWPQPAGPGQSIFDGVRQYLEDPLGVPPTQIPLMITFPTLKDRGYTADAKYHTAQLLALAKLEWFGQIETENSVDGKTPAWKHPGRDEAYGDLKERWKIRLQEAFLTYYPKLSGKIQMFDISTPLSIEHYLPTGSGSAIGLDVNAGPDCRFTNFDTMQLLDMRTTVPGLWITGQDTLLCGVPLAQAAGLMTALRIAGPVGSLKIILQSIWLLIATFGERNAKNQPQADKPKSA